MKHLLFTLILFILSNNKAFNQTNNEIVDTLLMQVRLIKTKIDGENALTVEWLKDDRFPEDKMLELMVIMLQNRYDTIITEQPKRIIKKTKE